ncbi:MAG: RHS repeat protein, partial [Candidatus Solibacter sp.]|nr:RHS repeat protein [Candidatus Solibacter sp.]
MEHFRYNRPGQIVSKSQNLLTGYTPQYAISATVDYQYDYYGRLIRMQYPQLAVPDGQGGYTARPRLTLDYAYDPMSRLQNISLPNAQSLQIANGAAYNAAGQLKSLTRPAQVNLGASPVTADGMLAETFEYNTLGQITSQVWAQPGMSVNLQYEYAAQGASNDGRLYRRRDVVSGEEVTYLYDQLGRLTSATTTGPEWGLSWTYDGFGNRLQQNVTKGSGLSVQMTVNPATNRLSGTGYVYDSNGNLTNWPTPLGGVTAGYDATNQMTSVSAPNGTETYQYSARRQRLFKHFGGTTLLSSKQYVYGAGGELLGEYSACQVTPGVYVLCQDQVRVY